MNREAENTKDAGGARDEKAPNDSASDVRVPGDEHVGRSGPGAEDGGRDDSPREGERIAKEVASADAATDGTPADETKETVAHDGTDVDEAAHDAVAKAEEALAASRGVAAQEAPAADEALADERLDVEPAADRDAQAEDSADAEDAQSPFRGEGRSASPASSPSDEPAVAGGTAEGGFEEVASTEEVAPRDGAASTDVFVDEDMTATIPVVCERFPAQAEPVEELEVEPVESDAAGADVVEPEAVEAAETETVEPEAVEVVGSEAVGPEIAELETAGSEADEAAEQWEPEPIGESDVDSQPEGPPTAQAGQSGPERSSEAFVEPVKPVEVAESQAVEPTEPASDAQVPEPVEESAEHAGVKEAVESASAAPEEAQDEASQAWQSAMRQPAEQPPGSQARWPFETTQAWRESESAQAPFASHVEPASEATVGKPAETEEIGDPAPHAPAEEEGRAVSKTPAAAPYEGHDDHTPLVDAVFVPAAQQAEKPPRPEEPVSEASESDAGPDGQDLGSPAFAEADAQAQGDGAAATPASLYVPQESRSETETFAVASPVPAEEKAKPARRRSRRTLVGVAAAFAFLVLGYVGASFFFADKIPSGTKVAGVDVGGLSRADAQAKLTKQLGPRANQQVTVKIGSQTKALNPESFDARFDAKATVNSLTGFSLSPSRMWRNFAGGQDVAPKLDVDNAKMKTTLEILANETDTPAVNATLSFNGTTPVTSQAAKGQKIDVDEAVKVVEKKMLEGQPIALPLLRPDPDVTDAEVAEASKKLAQPLVSGPLRVTLDSTTSVDVTPAQLATAATFTPKNGSLVMTLGPRALGDVVRSKATSVLRPGKDARIEIVNHTTPQIIPSEPGVGIDDDQLAAEAVKVVGVGGSRQVNLKPSPVEAAFTTQDAQKMGVKEIVAEIETPLTDDTVRTRNLQVGTGKVTNTLVKPGDNFSLLNTLGPIDAAHGFAPSGVVDGGFNSTAMGGGLSQLSTNTYNLGFLAGYDDIQHKPHSKYFARYPMGREATLWEGKVDMIWKNNTPYGAVVDTWVADGKVHSRLWSTKYWKVETRTSAPYNQTSPTTKYNPRADCQPSGAGPAGFTVDIWRKVSRDGTVHREETNSWTYQPVDAVVCTPQ